MTAPTVPTLPPAPSRNSASPDAYIDIADAWAAALPAFGDAVEAVGQYAETTSGAIDVNKTAAQAAQLAAEGARDTAQGYAAQTAADRTQTGANRAVVENLAAGLSFTSTSATGNTIGTGSKTFTVQTSESYAAGMPIYVVDQASTLNYMVGTCTSYNPADGQLVVLVSQVGGSGTKTAWNISIGGIPGVQGPPWSGGTLTSAINGAPPVTLASAATVNIGAVAANDVTVTGTTSITAFDTIAAGAERRVTFSGSLNLTHNATSLILPGGASITTAAGDVATVVSLGSGNWRCVDYEKANGQAVVASIGGVVGDIVASTTRQPNALPCRGGAYSKAAYPALSLALGNLFPKKPTAFTVQASSLTTLYPHGGGSVSPTGKWGYTAFKTTSSASSGDLQLYRYTMPNVAPTALTPVIKTATTDACVGIACSSTHVVLLMTVLSGNHYLRYNTIDSAGALTGTWTDYTPTGITNFNAGWGVCNGVFWIAYNIGGTATALRIAWGSNPASMTVSTPSGTGAAMANGYGALMFYDPVGAQYVLWSSSQQVFFGANMGALVRNASLTTPQVNPYISGSGVSYSARGDKCIFKNLQTGNINKVDDYGVSGLAIDGLIDNTASIYTFNSAAFAGDELFVMATDNSVLKIHRVDYGSLRILEVGTATAGLTTSITNVGTGMMFGFNSVAGHYMFYGTDLNIGTSFYVPNIVSPSGDFQIRAL